MRGRHDMVFRSRKEEGMMVERKQVNRVNRQSMYLAWAFRDQSDYVSHTTHL